MLASITPLGERGRNSHYAVTVTTFLAGATGAGAAVGLILGGLGDVVAGDVDYGIRLRGLALVALVALIVDQLPRNVPGPRRQVNEQWLDRYRSWVYGLGFGAQLGAGVMTIVTSAATYVTLLAAFLAARPASGALIVAAFGLGRGLTPLIAAPVRRPDQLVSLHAAMDGMRGPVAGLGAAVLVAIFALSLVGALL
jgi:hypothetical protein